MMNRFPIAALVAAFLFTLSSCDGSSPKITNLEGTYTLVSENDQPLPSDPWAPYGCCVTLSGYLTLTADTYDLGTSHRARNNDMEFENSEQGTYTWDGNSVVFTRTGLGGVGYPYLLAPGTVSADGRTITVLYGDEGPGSNQVRATFQR